jgi:GNAT superfamily N-acetyltransferase
VQVDRETFVATVKELYIQKPSQVSDLAFWKLARMLRESEVHARTRDGHTYLYAIQDQRLVFYWSDDRQDFYLTPEEIVKLQFLVLHDDFYTLIADHLGEHQVQESRPLLYDFRSNHEFQRDDGFVIADFDFKRDGDRAEAADMLNRCYDTDHHTPPEVAGWFELPVFDSSLWFWVRSRAGGEAVGLAISTYQPDIRECYLDWIQVLPAYHGRGLGQLLVHETIQRAKGKSEIIRVTGVADDFYRKCGFYGTERWWIASRSQT